MSRELRKADGAHDAAGAGAPEDRAFRRFCSAGDPADLAETFDATAGELFRVGWYLTGGSRDLAEDALQSTFLTALEQRARWDPGRPVRAWLLGILANHVRTMRRKEGLRAGTGDAGLLDALPWTGRRPDDPVEAAEVRQLVREAVATQAEPYRSVLQLHLDLGLGAPQIADRLGRKAATVRTQIARGLESLRRSLPAGLAGGGAGFALPTPEVVAAGVGSVRQQVLGHAVATAAAAGSGGAVLAGARHPVFLALVLVAGAVLVSYLVPLLAGIPQMPPSLEASGSEPVEAARAAQPAPSRSEPRTAPPTAPVPNREGQGRPPGDEVRVRVVASDRTPRPGAVVVLEADDVRLRATADDEGLAVFDLGGRAHHSLRSLQVGVLGTSATAFAMPTVQGVREYELVVEPGVDLEVRVVDPSGQPVEGAVVEGVLGFQWSRMYNDLGRTGSDGVLRLRDAASRGQLRAYASGWRMSGLADFDAGPGQARRVTLTLQDGAVAARGAVVGADGDPLPEAEMAVVQCGAILQTQYFSSGPDGRFRVDWLAPGRHVLMARVRTAGERGWRMGELVLDHSGGGAEPELRLEVGPTATLTGRITDPAGMGLEQAAVYVECVRDGAGEMPFGSGRVRTAPDGSYEIRDLMPGAVTVRVSHAGTEVRETLELERAGVRTHDVALEPSAPIRVKLVDAAGAPLVGWSVGLRSLEGFPRGSTVFTDGDGVASGLHGYGWELAPDDLRAVVVRAPVALGDEPGAGRRHSALPVFVTPPFGPGEHVVAVPGDARPEALVRGRVCGADGRTVRTKVTLILDAMRRSAVDGSVSTWTGVEEDGEFVFDQLPGGDYTLRVEAEGHPPMERPLRLLPGESRALGVLQAPRQGRLVVVVDRSANRVDRLSAEVQARSGFRRRMEAVGSARFELDGVPCGPATVTLWGRETPVRRQVVEVDAATEVRMVAAPTTACTEVVVVLPADTERWQAGWSGVLRVKHPETGDLVLSRRVRHTFRGRFEPELSFGLPIAPGRWRVEVSAWNGRVGAAEGRVGEPGAPRRIRIELPGPPGAQVPVTNPPGAQVPVANPPRRDAGEGG